MPLKSKDVLSMRIDVLSLAITEIARALPDADALRVPQALSGQFAQFIDAQPIGECADESLAADIAALMAALTRNAPVSCVADP
jgi:hypothetical protein